jgi:uncharacterized membrane protein
MILMRPEIPSRLYDDEDRLRVIALRSTPDALADSCFDQIRQSAATNASVLVHTADTLGKLARSRDSDVAHRVVARHLDRIEECAQGAGSCGSDHAFVLDHVRAARAS